MSSLIITKQTGNFFSLVLDGGGQIISEQNRLTTIGNLCNFKTANGANLILKQNILYSEITIVTSGSHVPTSINDLWSSLITAGFFDGLGTGGGGGGVDNFTELLDTFSSYIGRDGQVLVVNESMQRIETVDISLFTAEEKAKLEGIETGAEVNIQTDWNETDPTSDAYLKNKPSNWLNAVGSFDYSDLATQTTPIAVTAGVPTKLTNDTLGAYTNVQFAPYGVSTAYNATTNQFDFSSLSLGDQVSFRTDLDIDLVGTNTSYVLELRCAVGDVSAWTLPVHNGERKSTNSFQETHEFSIVMNYQFTIDNPAELWLTTDANADVKVNGYQLKILRKDINIVTLNDTKLDKDGYIGTAQTLKDEIDAINAALPTEYTTIVYIDTTDPSTATIFDDVNPPVTNDPLLEDDTANLYIGTDSSTWVYNGSIYTTKVVPETSNFTINGTEVDAGNNKTSPISRLFPVTVQEKFNDTADNSGSSLNPRHFGFWKWLSGVQKYGKIKWDNIGFNVTFQLPNTADNSTETFAMVSDLDAKQNQLTAGTNITIDVTDPLNPVISASGGIGEVLIDASLRYYNNGVDDVLGSNISDFVDKIVWNTGDSTIFDLSFVPTNLLSIHVNGLKLYKASQFTILLPDQIEILQTLFDEDVIEINYQHYNEIP